LTQTTAMVDAPQAGASTFQYAQAVWGRMLPLHSP
jgi:hypothetical protein